MVILIAYFAPKDDRTFYRQGSAQKPNSAPDTPGRPKIAPSVAFLFGSGEKQLKDEQKKSDEAKKHKVVIRYFAPQVLGSNGKGPKGFRSGSKLVGVLLNPIDTRAQGAVRVRIVHGGEAAGVSIDPGSILLGQFSYQGSGARVQISFTRIDGPDGDSRKIAATAISAADYTPGISGEEYTGNGIKVATALGLTMFSGMTDTLTEREALSNSAGGVQAKPSMKNALLQGLTQAAKDQAGRTASGIGQEKNYVLVPDGAEMIIELTEEFKNERK